ncbi:MAG: glycolate oxidase iron-sulfur subunit, partial [Rhizobiaceae bacterium]|nr:glycolate oxidase iron-sulfur subunit [Rhizobiaceae bacterium]
YKRPFMDRLFRAVLAMVLPYPSRFRFALNAAKLAKPFAGLFAKIPSMKPMAAMLALAPTSLPAAIKLPTVTSAETTKIARVAMLSGCAQQVLDPRINAATLELLSRIGVEIVVPAKEGCCGALVHHMGREDASLAAARNNIDAWWHEIENGGLDAIIITTSGCGTTVKDYGHMLRLDPDYAEKAATIASLAKDITEYLSSRELDKNEKGKKLKLAYHSACSMQHGQKIKDEPKRLLSAVGFDVVDIPEGHLCCGSAGTYNILQSEIAGRLKDRKLRNIAKVKPDLIAAGNIGCLTQLSADAGVPMCHTVELLNWAYGGAMPKGMEGLLGEA